jgi:signal peptidase I
MTSLAQKASGLWETAKTVFWALLIAVLFRSILFQPFWIPSGSMKETLLIGDFLFVNKFAYGWSRYSCPLALCPITGRLFGAMPERGDIVVFRHPVTGDDYIKRLIGLPGDRIRMHDGLVFINGEPVSREPTAPFVEERRAQGPLGQMPRCSNIPVARGGACEKARAIETLPNGVHYPVLSIAERGPSDTTREFVVPDGHFFFMGDNRDNSVDSRVAQDRGGVGFVPFENLIGRADRVVFSSAGSSMLAFWTWRMDRFFHGLQS